MLPSRKRSHDHHHSHHPKSARTSASDSGPVSRSSTASIASSPTTPASSSAYTSRGTTPADTASPSDAEADSSRIPSPTIAVDITDEIHQLANDEDNVSDSASEDSADTDFSSGDPPNPEQQLVTVSGAEKRFVDSMIRERISIRGRIREMEPVEECEAFVGLNLESVGAVHGDGPIVKWLKAREEWSVVPARICLECVGRLPALTDPWPSLSFSRDHKFSKALSKHRASRITDRQLASQTGYLSGLLPNDTPPLCSLAGFHDEVAARAYGKSVDEVGRRGQSVSGLLGAWMKMGQKKEEERAGDQEIRKMEKQMEEIGIDKEVSPAPGLRSSQSLWRRV